MFVFLCILQILLLPSCNVCLASCYERTCQPDLYVGFSKLMCEIACGTPPKEIEQLIKEGADVNGVHSDMFHELSPVLRYALDRGTDEASVAIIRMLVQAGANVNAITYNRVVDQMTYGMMPLITYAAIYSSPEVVQFLIDSGADVDYKVESSLGSGKTALQHAQELHKQEVVAILQNANPDKALYRK